MAAAIRAFDRAESMGASADRCSGGRWMASALQGDFDGAWKESDSLRHRDAPDPHRFWNGEDIRGKRLIVRSLHGLGDAVQMLRYAPLLGQLAASVVYEVAPQLLPLAPFFRGVLKVCSWGLEASIDPPEWDIQVEVMELPYLFRTTLKELPVATGYLEVPTEFVQRAGFCMGGCDKPRIGLVWSGGDWNASRSIPFDLLRSVLSQSSFEFWNLQNGPVMLEANGTGIRSATTLCGDGILALAATMVHLDLIITVDTLAAHLAGALGKPAWVILQHAADWRWMTKRTDSPWYPTLRLFRQPRPGDWMSVVESLSEELRVHGAR